MLYFWPVLLAALLLVGFFLFSPKKPESLDSGRPFPGEALLGKPFNLGLNNGVVVKETGLKISFLKLNIDGPAENDTGEFLIEKDGSSQKISLKYNETKSVFSHKITCKGFAVPYDTLGPGPIPIPQASLLVLQE